MNVPTMTVGKGEMTEQEKLQAEVKAENEELKAERDALREKIRHMEDKCEHAYLRGRVDGLEFSIRCNGVSGDEVR